MATTKDIDKSGKQNGDAANEMNGHGQDDDEDLFARPPEVRGRTFIGDNVVSIIARRAAEQVPGVHALGESSLRAMLSRLGRHHGVGAEVGMKEAAVDVEIVVTFGYQIKAVAQALRKQIIESVEYMTGRRVVEVDVNVIDIYVPKEEKATRRQLE